MVEFTPVAKMDEIDDGGMIQVKVDDTLIGLYRVGDEVYAMNDVCTHEEAYLTEGYFDPDELEVECPLHGSCFNVATGAVRILPATKPEPTYEVKIEAGEIFVGLPKSDAAKE
jgi:3-phenylpropionate/trans-cinnamate dioxygenase ferredoxin subunit